VSFFYSFAFALDSLELEGRASFDLESLVLEAEEPLGFFQPILLWIWAN
jgi:hypothetical protein